MPKLDSEHAYSGHDRATAAACSLSRRERGGVRGYKLSRDPNPLTPTLSPAGRGSPAVPRGESVLNTFGTRTTRAMFILALVAALAFWAAPAAAQSVADF